MVIAIIILVAIVLVLLTHIIISKKEFIVITKKKYDDLKKEIKTLNKTIENQDREYDIVRCEITGLKEELKKAEKIKIKLDRCNKKNKELKKQLKEQ